MCRFTAIQMKYLLDAIACRNKKTTVKIRARDGDPRRSAEHEQMQGRLLLFRTACSQQNVVDSEPLAASKMLLMQGLLL